jgi:hypothetical protein
MRKGVKARGKGERNRVGRLRDPRQEPQAGTQKGQ